MDHDLRMERRRVRLFFAGLLVISAALDIVGALLVHRQTRSEVLETLLPATVTLGGRAGALLSGVSLLLLAVGIARGKRIAFRLTVAVLIATIAFELVKDLDFEDASLFAWLLFGLGGGGGVRGAYARRSGRACAGRPQRAARDRPPSHS